MVNLFRKYQQGLMIIVTILVIIAFAWLYNGTRFEKIGAGVVAKIYNRNLLQADVDRIARKFSLSYQLGLSDLAQDLGDGRSQSEALENFVWNSLVLEHEAERLQIEPTEDEVFTSLKTLPAFQTNGAFDAQKYATILQDALAPRGFTQDQLEQMVREDLRLKKIKALIGSTVEISPAEFRALYTQQNQKMEISVVRFKLVDFYPAAPASANEKAIEILKKKLGDLPVNVQPGDKNDLSDENLKKAFDQRKDTLKSDEKRKIKYVNFALSDPEKALKGKERLEALQKLANNADEFAQAALAKEAKFDEIAARYKVKVNETGEFAQAEPDAALAKIPGAVEAAFKLNQGDASADIVRTEEGFYILHLESITPSRLLTFDEAKQKLTEQLRNERAHEAMSLKAAEIRNKIDADVRAGKSFADAAKAQGVKVEAFPPSSLAEPNLDKPDGREIVGKAIEMNDGQLSEFVPTENGGLLVHLDKRTPIDEAKFEKEKTAQSADYARGRREAAFREWLRLQRVAAKVPSA